MAARPAWWSAWRLGQVLGVLALVLGLCGLLSGSSGWSLAWHEDAALITAIRAPRTLGAFLTGGLLGLAGAIAQGVFCNPLADPYLLGSASGAVLGIVLTLSGGAMVGVPLGFETADALARVGLVGAAFLGAWAGVLLTLLMARGVQRPTVLLLSGIVVGVVLGAVANLVMVVSPEALRGAQAFLLGSTSFLGWTEVVPLAVTLVLALPMALAVSRVLDALTLGEHTAQSLGLPVGRMRALLVLVLAACTGTAVAQTGLIAFVGLVAPHLVRRSVMVTHRGLLILATLTGGVLLLAADILARSVLAPQELPVGVLTAVLGGGYLVHLLHSRMREVP
jgi:iron complex transport system permease protein